MTSTSVQQQQASPSHSDGTAPTAKCQFACDLSSLDTARFNAHHLDILNNNSILITNDAQDLALRAFVRSSDDFHLDMDMVIRDAKTRYLLRVQRRKKAHLITTKYMPRLDQVDRFFLGTRATSERNRNTSRHRSFLLATNVQRGTSSSVFLLVKTSSVCMARIRRNCA